MKRGVIFLCVLLVIFFSFGKAKAEKLIYFNAGNQEELSTEKLPEVLDAFDKIVAGTDDLYQLIVTPRHIREMKDQRQGIEILLSRTKQIQLKKKTYEADRFLLLFCSEPVCEQKNATFYFGQNGDYFTPPYVNSKGGVYIDQIKKIIGK